jgi:hypothetical protein
MAAVLPWVFISFVIAFGTVMLGATLTLLISQGTRPYWYIACLRAIGKRIGLE